MKYAALLRGINVGGGKKVEMKRLKELFESLGNTNVSTYINSGNVLFESEETVDVLQKKLESKMKNDFGFDVSVLVKTIREMKAIADAIPSAWQNDSLQKSDVIYLFKEADSKKTVDELPVKLEYLSVKYVKGAILLNVKRNNYNKSRLNKIIGCKLYKFMTVRNVNTARRLAGIK